MLKICTHCKMEKDISQFKLKENNDQTKSFCYCINCGKIKKQKSLIKARARRQRWLNKNLDKRKEYEHNYYLNNINDFKIYTKTDAFKESKRKYKQKRRATDSIFRMRENISNAIGKALRNNKSNKAGQSILQFLNYTIIELKIHLENKFNSNMSWDNYGKYWHIDHITPQSDLPYSSMQEDNFQRCWSLSNLRPLEAKQNLLDGARRVRHKN